jgi:hypothetical protein
MSSLTYCLRELASRAYDRHSQPMCFLTRLKWWRAIDHQSTTVPGRHDAQLARLRLGRNIIRCSLEVLQ